MKTCFQLLLPCLLLVGCLSKHTESFPIDADKVEAILIDVHVAESAMATIINAEKKDSLANLYYSQIAEIHGIDTEMLDTLFAILQRNPELAQEAYAKMSEHLEKKALEK